MLEVDSLDVVGLALDRVTKLGVPVTVTLGKHTNDLMTSFYLRTPSGCDLEYGVGGRLLDDSWTIVVNDARPRPATTPAGVEVTIHDTVLRATRY